MTRFQCFDLIALLSSKLNKDLITHLIFLRKSCFSSRDSRDVIFDFNVF